MGHCLTYECGMLHTGWTERLNKTNILKWLLERAMLVGNLPWFFMHTRHKFIGNRIEHNFGLNQCGMTFYFLALIAARTKYFQFNSNDKCVQSGKVYRCLRFLPIPAHSHCWEQQTYPHQKIETHSRSNWEKINVSCEQSWCECLIYVKTKILA